MGSRRKLCLLVQGRKIEWPQSNQRVSDMSFRLDTRPDLHDTFAEVIDHQYALTLAPLAKSLKNPVVRFEDVEENGVTRYRCMFSARTGGETMELACEHQDARIAIGDTFSRARRAVSRRRGRLADPYANRTAQTSQPR